MLKKNGIVLGIMVLSVFIYQYGIYMFDHLSEVISNKVTTNIEEVDTENQEYINQEQEQQKECEDQEKATIILDPGHGGADPGMIGINQALEKDLNLEVARKVYDILLETDYIVLMTREEDSGMNPSEGLSKVEDLDARVTMMNEANPKLVVSIHQNSYSSESIHGAQVFYYTGSSEGAIAAQILQEALLAVDPENTRKIEANNTYYLLKKTQVPTIIVECGFLSNALEADKLIDDEYQQDLAEAIASGIIEYIEESVL